jgi:hypothetical protein
MEKRIGSKRRIEEQEVKAKEEKWNNGEEEKEKHEKLKEMKKRKLMGR